MDSYHDYSDRELNEAVLRRVMGWRESETWKAAWVDLDNKIRWKDRNDCVRDANLRDDVVERVLEVFPHLKHLAVTVRAKPRCRADFYSSSPETSVSQCSTSRGRATAIAALVLWDREELA